MVKKLGISEFNVRNMWLRCYKLNCCHFLNEGMKAKPLAKSRRMLCHRWRSSFTQSPTVQEGTTENYHTKLLPCFRHLRNWKNAGDHRQKPQNQRRELSTVSPTWCSKDIGDAILRHRFTLQQEWEWAPTHLAQSTIAACEELFIGFWSKDVWPPNLLNLFHLKPKSLGNKIRYFGCTQNGVEASL